MMIVFAALILMTSAPVLVFEPDDAPRDGEEIIFDVYRNGGSHFGTHTVRFNTDGDDLIAEISIRLRAGFGPLTVFRYEHDASERWREGDLVAKRSRTLKDGDTYEMEARLEDGVLRINGENPDGEPVVLALDPSTFPTSHWRGYQPDMEALLNTEHGTLMETEIRYLGEEEIEADGGTILATRIRVASSLTVDLWYDRNGRWAGCLFEARGQSIRYVRRANPVSI